ncbi:Rrf2 family transcriptional regulator [Chryseobacterium suipulveris]|uniref:Rrf2 family transcriptional regulator n=1 Tax=Chryseobacterium suipulveris TaxID=2929800 RepID=A0ABY4BMP3_9FLAO|nr:Rrf2 family transcriptional regulator [Chryseobacterium suipulveris]UOE40380.1 Rrf2 family transcriptional regulator [Chryseobacterium suipulveris]
MFSKSCEYGIRASIYIAKQSLKDRKVSQKEIAKSIDSPEAFTAKILQKLSKTNVIRSMKGPNGGFFVDGSDLERVKLWNIVFALDGNSLLEDCSLGLQKCNAEKPCPLHHKFVGIRAEIREALEKTTLRALAEDVAVGSSYLKR